MIAFDLTQEQSDMRDLAHRFAEKEIRSNPTNDHRPASGSGRISDSLGITAEKPIMPNPKGHAKELWRAHENI
jgi:hypothetical protein